MSSVACSGVTPVGRVAYPRLFKARKRNEKTAPRYSVTLVFDESVDLTAFKAVVRGVVKEEFPNGVPGGFRNPFRKGSERRRDDGTLPEGFKDTDTFVEFWRYEDKGKQPNVGPDRDATGSLGQLAEADVYAGCQGRVSFRAYCWGKGADHGNRGVNLGLEAFQKTDEGTPIGETPINPDDAFGAAPAGSLAAAPPVAAPPVAAPPVAPPVAAPPVAAPPAAATDVDDIMF